MRSSILSNNEIDKDDKHNRKLFFRVKRGSYLFNPNLSIKVEGEWVNIYELMSIDKLALRHKQQQQWWHIDVNEHLAKVLEHNKTLIKKQLEMKKIEDPD